MSGSGVDGGTRLVWSQRAQAELRRVLRCAPLMAFDFDGTLAPIVARPVDARVPESTSRRLRALAARLKTAVITGRAVADVLPRLGFTPWQVIGSHGAEDPHVPESADLALTLEPVRRLLGEGEAKLRSAGVSVEDKGLSIALHYRLSRHRAMAVQAIDDLLVAFGEHVKVTHGKSVVNVVPRLARDKAAALRTLVARATSSHAIFVGDDVNDEPVFEAGEPDWLTIGVGTSAGAIRAQLLLESPSSMPRFLDQVLTLLDSNRS